MSNVIDQRTVEMRFDNQDFEKNVRSSMESIALFNKNLKGLKCDEASKSFDDLANRFKSFDMSKAVHNFDIFNAKLSDLFKLATKFAIIDEIKNTFDSLSHSILGTAKSMTQLSQMTAGWNKYAEKTTSVQTIMSATGKTIDEVSAALDKLNWYSDETSASFTDMTSNIGKFTSAGVELEDAVRAMEGIFNWTSTSGRSLSEASRVMYNLSQAVGVGSVKLMDWRSIENANMATVEFKNTVLDTGVALGKLEKVGNDYYTKIGKRQKINAQIFSSTLNTGWFDKDILISTLKRYSEFTEKVYQYMEEHPEYDTVAEAMESMKDAAKAAGEEFDELGYKWFLSAQEAKTFTDVVDSVKDAVSTGWMKTFELIFGNYEQARHMWTDLANDLYEVIATPMNDQNDFLTEVMTSSYSKLKKEIIKAGLSVDEFEKELYESVSTVEADKKALDGLIEEYGSIGAVLEAGEINVDWVTKAFKKLADAGEDGKKTFATVEEITQIVKDTWNTNKYGTGQERRDAYKALGYDPDAMQKLVVLWNKKGKLTIEDIEAVGISAGKATSEVWADFIEQNGELVDSLDEVSGRTLLIGGITNVVKTLTGGFVSIRDAFNETFSPDPEAVHDFLENFYEFTDKIKLTEEGAETLNSFVSGLLSPIKILGRTGGRILSAFVGDSLTDFGANVSSVFSKAGKGIVTFQKRFTKVFASLEDSKYIDAFVEKVSEFGKTFRASFSSGLGTVTGTIKSYFNKSFLGSRINKYADQFKNIWAEVNKNGGNAFDNLIKAGKIFKDKWIQDHGDDWSPFGAVWDGLKTDLDKFKNTKLFTSVKSGITSFWDNITEHIFGKDYKKNKEYSSLKLGLKKDGFFGNFIQNVESGFNEIKSRLSKSTIGRKLSAARKALPLAFEEFKTFLGKGWGLEGSLRKAKEKFLSAFDKFFDITSGRKKPFSKAGAAAKRFKDQAVSRIKNALFSGGDKTGPFSGILKYLEGVKKIFVPKFREAFEFLPNLFSNLFKKSGDGNSLAPKGPSISDKLKKWFEPVKNAFSSLIEWSKPVFTWFKDNFLKDLNLETLVSSFTSILSALSVYNFSKISKNFGDFLDTLGTKIKGIDIANDIKKTVESIAEIIRPIKEQNKNLKARTFLAYAAGITLIAAAIGLIAAAIYEISLIDDAGLQKASLVVGGIATFITAYTVLISKLDFHSKSSGSIDTKSKFSQFFESTGNVIKLIGTILAISIVLKNAGTAFKSMAEAINIISASVEKFADLAANKEKFDEGLKAVIDIILSLGASTGLAGLGFANMFGGTAVTLLAMAGSVRLLYDSVVKFMALATLDKGALESSINFIGDLMMELGKAVAVAGLTGGMWFGLGGLGTSLTLLAFVGAIRALQGAVIEFSKIPAYDLENSVNAINSMIDSLTNASFWSVLASFGGIGKALTIVAFGKAIQMIVGSIQNVMEMSQDGSRFETATNVIRGLMRTLTGWIAVLGIVNGFGSGISIAQAAAIAAFGLSIKLISDSIIGLSQLNETRLKRGGNAVGMIALIIGALSIVVGLTARIGKGESISLGAAAMILAFAKAINNIADVLIKLSDYPEEDLKQAKGTLIIISACIAVFALIIAKCNSFSGSKAFGLNIIAIAGAIYLIGEEIAKLGKIPTEELIKGEAAVSILMLVLAGSIALMNLGSKTNSWMNALNIVALTGSLFVLADVAKKFGDMSTEQLIKAGIAISALLTALTLVGKFMSKTGSIASIQQSVSIAIIAAAVALLTEVAKTFAEMEWPEMGKVGAGLGGMLLAMTFVTKIINTTIKSFSLGTIIKGGLIVGAIGVVLAALGYIFDIPFLSKGLDKGATFIGKLGSALGQFLGGIAGGAAAGWAANLPAVGKSMGEFGTNAAPFFEAIKGLDGLDVGAILLSLVAADQVQSITEGMNKLFNIFGINLSNYEMLKGFGAALTEIAPGVSAYITATNAGDVGKIDSVTAALKELNRINFREMNVNREEGEKIPLQRFAEEIIAASASIEEAINTLNALPSLTDNASTAIESLISFGSTVFTPSGVSAEFSASGEVFKKVGDDIFGPHFETNMKLIFTAGDKAKNYISSLAESKTNLDAFFGALNSINLVYDEESGKLKANVISDALDQFAKIDISNWYGANIRRFSDFASDLKQGAGDIKTFVDSLNSKDFELPDETKFAGFVKIMTDLAGIKMPDNYQNDMMTGIKIPITALQLVQGYRGAIDQIDMLADEIKQRQENFDLARGLADIYAIFNPDTKIDPDRLKGLPEAISGFVKDLNTQLSGQTISPELATGLESINGILTELDSLTEFGFSKVATDIASGISYLAITNKNGDELKKARDAVQWFSDFAYRLFRIQNDLSLDTFELNLTDVMGAINRSFATLHDPGLKLQKILDLFNSIKDLYALDFSYEGGEPDLQTNKLAAAFALLSDAIDRFAPDNEQSELETYISWLEGLSGKKETFTQAAEALNSLVPNVNKMETLTNFINSLKGEFLKTSSEMYWDPYWQTYSLREGENGDVGYFGTIAKDLAGMSDVLKEGDFTELENWTNQLNPFSQALSSIEKSNAEKIASHIYSVLTAINEAILGDGTEEGKPALVDNLTEHFGVFDSISEVFSQIEGYKDQGLESVIPNILSGISTSITDFNYDPAGMERVRQAVAEIKKLLGIGEDGTPDEFSLGGPQLPRLGMLDSLLGGHNTKRVRPVSKAEEAAQRASDRKDANPNAEWIESLSDALSGMSVDPDKVNMITDISSAIATISEKSVQANNADFSGVVSEIAESLEKNEQSITTTGMSIGELLAEVFRNFYPAFFKIGSTFIVQVCMGMYSQAAFAVQTSAALATMMLVSFQETVSAAANETGAMIATSIAEAISSDDNASIINDAIDSLFGLTDEENLSEDTQYNPGGKFAEKFLQGFQDGLNLEESGIDVFSSFADTLDTFAESFDFTETANLIAAGATAAVETVSEPVGLLNDTLSAAVPDGAGLANNMIDGMINALIARTEEACLVMAAFASAVAESAKSALDINSPSKVFYEIGENTVEGFVNAVNDGTGDATASFGRLASLSVMSEALLLQQQKVWLKLLKMFRMLQKKRRIRSKSMAWN